jgi:polyisoprenoid-binding protein YceI
MMREEVLETASNPLITFDSNDVKANSTRPSRYGVELRGKMTVHGSTRDQLIPVRVTIGGDRLRASGEFSLYQNEYGITLVSLAGGALKVKDEVKVSFRDHSVRRKGAGHGSRLSLRPCRGCRHSS